VEEEALFSRLRDFVTDPVVLLLFKGLIELTNLPLEGLLAVPSNLDGARRCFLDENGKLQLLGEILSASKTSKQFASGLRRMDLPKLQRDIHSLLNLSA
jgi:hypothetical protein